MGGDRDIFLFLLFCELFFRSIHTQQQYARKGPFLLSFRRCSCTFFLVRYCVVAAKKVDVIRGRKRDGDTTTPSRSNNYQQQIVLLATGINQHIATKVDW